MKSVDADEVPRKKFNLVVSIVGCPARLDKHDRLILQTTYDSSCVRLRAAKFLLRRLEIIESSFLIVQLSYLICYSCVETQIWLNLSGTVMFHAGVIRMVVDCLCLGKHGRREDNNFEGRVAMKSNLQPQVLQGKLVMLTFKQIRC